jgi:WD40 repeat protein
VVINGKDSIEFWNVESGKRQRSISFPEGDSTCDISPDEKLGAATTHDDHLIVVDLKTGTERWKVKRSLLTRPAFSPDGKVLALANEGRIAFFDTNHEPNCRTQWAYDRIGNELEVGAPITALKFSPDGRSIGVLGADGRLRLTHRGRLLANEVFVRVLPEGVLPTTRAVVGSNFCDVAVIADSRTRRAVCLSAIDNLGKGGAANGVQNLNLMSGWDERTGLDAPPVYP